MKYKFIIRIECDMTGQKTTTQKLNRKQREQKRKKFDILGAALKVFAEKGFRGATMAQISRTSEYPLGTIYKFFSSKDQIYHDLVIEKGYALGDILFEIAQKKKVLPIKKLHECLLANASYCKENKAFIQIFISWKTNMDLGLMADFDQSITRMYERMMALYSRIFEEGIACGDFRTFDSQVMAVLFVGVIFATMWFWLMETAEDTTLEKKLNTAFSIFTEGICESVQKKEAG